MPETRRKLAVLTLFAMFLWPMLLAAALPKRDDAPQGATSLAGQLLVATQAIGDPRFSHSVILLVQHGKDGAFGIIINRPVQELPMAKLLAALGQDSTGVTGDVRIFAGGPVEQQIGFIVHDAAYHQAKTINIDGRVAMTSDPQVLRDIGRKEGPGKSLVAFGYAGWGPGQLEDELTAGAWFTIPEDPKLVFEVDRDKLWEMALARQTIPL